MEDTGITSKRTRRVTRSSSLKPVTRDGGRKGSPKKGTVKSSKASKTDVKSDKEVGTESCGGSTSRSGVKMSRSSASGRTAMRRSGRIVKDKKASDGVAVVSSGGVKRGAGRTGVNADRKTGTGAVHSTRDSSGASSDSDSDLESYYVEKILDKAVDKDDGTSYYYIKWKGWPEYTNTWEPLENLDGCQETLEEFEKQYAKKKKSKR